jgi:hypothetical protein
MSFDGLAPNTLNYMVGKGKVYFSRLDENNNPLGELDLGNDPVFAVTLENEKLEHYSSMEGVKKKDLSAIISTDMSVKFTLDEINVHNLNLAMFGNDEIGFVTQADGNEVNEAVTARLNRYVKLVRRNLTNGTVVVTDSTGVTTYVENTDYRIDYSIGRIYCLSTGGILQGEALLVDYTYGAVRIPKVTPAGRAKVEGLLRFVGDSTYGRDFEIVLWKVQLSVSGDINFISDEWAQMEFTGEVLDDSTNHPNDPYGMVLDPDGDQIVES